ncbi:MAG: endonuclease/exonuclease/phosphatase family protein [Anaerolineales bacterium]|nr:endonuclease/exonuclease/phosphatase family protein [Anaerolineales bacterium]MCS7247416.1 endonuclease/exonuclease/phosphatase family protein [Anaerolineales bacterium]MDW8161227.1 endonuclease/exonuclease/phosphatase family protein [Anaerolineales bacterium]MDW8446013.1 endonuclease/exonuclease/phosphatase family protein [Anaerolineales bacterium]
MGISPVGGRKLLPLWWASDSSIGFGLVFLLLITLPAIPARTHTSSTVAICQIQGRGFTSAWKDQFVYVQGIVTADFDRRQGLIAIYQPTCDQDPRTSDALWIHLQQKVEVVRRGDHIQVGGIVTEYFGRTEIETTYAQITYLSSDNPLPEATTLLPPQRDSQSKLYFESLEGMLVQVPLANVVGPTDSYDSTWLMPAAMEVKRLFYNDPRGTGGVLAVDDRGDYELGQALKVGDQVANMLGVLDEAYEAYRVYLLEEATVLEAPFWGAPQAPPLSSINAFRLATFNLANLFDTEDDPDVNDTVLSRAEYQRRLRKRALVIREVLGEPELIALQEAENERVLRDLIARPELTAPYEIIWEETPDLRGLDVALLYRSDRLRVTDVRQEQGCTDLRDGLGPDGNQNVTYPENTSTCDLDGDGVAEGNRLFLRPPLVVKLELETLKGRLERAELLLLVNHWKSKVEDSPWQAYTLPRRTREAEFTARLIQQLRLEFPETPILLAGDLNDFPTSLPIQKLLAIGMVDLTQMVSPEQRYSYVYRGVSQTIDYLMLDPGKGLYASQLVPLHINADYPYTWAGRDDTPIRSSDHDLWQANFYFPLQNYLPLVSR